MPRPWRRGALALSLVTLVAAGAAGCVPGRGTTTPSAVPTPLPAVEVDDEHFASAVRQILLDGSHGPQRAALLAGIVRRQLQHASELALGADSQRAAASVVGALYLLRTTEGRDDLVPPGSEAGLLAAFGLFSARGDEGRSLAVLDLARRALPPDSAERAELDEHGVALDRWVLETRNGAPMSRLRIESRAAIDRSLVDPREPVLRVAVAAVEKWIERALEYNRDYRRTGRVPVRDEAIEAFRALRTGALTMAAIFLRHGRAADAVAAIRGSVAQDVTDPAVLDALETAASIDDARAWTHLAELYSLEPRLDDEGEAEPTVESALADAAVWGCTLEAYRRAPTSFQASYLLGAQLAELGMPEVTPLVLAGGLGERPPLPHLGAALALVMDALSTELDDDTPSRARRLFGAASGVLALADAEPNKADLRPSAAQLRQLMAGIELRAGDASAARPLLERALEDEPSVWGYTMLGTLERQLGNHEVALAHAVRASELPAAQVLALDAADARLLAFEILRDEGKTASAEVALEQALSIALTTRDKRMTPSGRVRAERLLARVLDGYGERSSASRALKRTLELADRNRSMLGRTMLDAVGRALVYRDLPAARGALGRGVEADVEPADMVYAALWLMLLERELGEAPDGQVNAVLATVSGADAWTSVLARWGRDRLDDAGLRSAAKTYAQKVEAEFYVAMRARALGSVDAAPTLKAVATNPLIDLMEVQIARALFAPQLSAKIPERYRVP